MFRAYFKQTKPTSAPEPHNDGSASSSAAGVQDYKSVSDQHGSEDDPEIFTGYLSDISEDDSDDKPVPEDNEGDGREERRVPVPAASKKSANADSPMLTSTSNKSHWSQAIGQHFPIWAPPPLRRCKLEIPARLARKQARQAQELELVKALADIEKLIKSNRSQFYRGANSLQAYRARAIQSYLQMVVWNKRKGIDASQRAAESQGFSEKWGGRLVRRWVRKWVGSWELPTSEKGAHAKTFSLLNDPAIRAELRSYVHSNKWCMDPAKLAQFSQEKMVPAAAKEYLDHITNVEIPKGLKKYLDIELFPQIHYKVGRGVSLSTAHQMLRREGFSYTEHKKALYYDGHERPDVVKYRQEVFLPAMLEYRKHLVEYKVDNLEEEVQKPISNYVERCLVLVPQDEMTAQANDGKRKSWVLDGEHALKKKGVGRGIHQSDIICSTFGWIKAASQSMEYGKNYEGYWTGELFVRQV